MIGMQMHGATSSGEAEYSRQGLTASLLRVLLGGMLAWLVVLVGVVLPFLAVNKAGVALVSSGFAVVMLLVPYTLLRRGRIMAAAWVFVTGGTIIGTIVMFLGRGTRGPGGGFQLAIAVIAAVLLGRNAALAVSATCLVADLGMAVFEVSGGRLPMQFPGTPLGEWAVLVLIFALGAPPMYLAINRLRAALDQLQTQLAERRNAEEQIVYQAQLIGQVPDPVIAADNNRKVTFWNAAAARLIGWPETEALGRSLDEVLPLPHDTVSKVAIREELGRTSKWNGEITLLTRAGEPVLVDAAISLLRNAAGEPIGLVGGWRDITERRRAEEALERSEERLHRITETVPVGITLLDSLGRIVFANSFVTSLFGISRQELLGRSYGAPEWDITDFAGNRVTAKDRPFLRVFTTGQAVSNNEFAVLTPQGKRVYLSVSAAPILGPGGKVEGVVAALEDVTGRRELEEQYRHAQKMESLGRLAGGIAHDFNNLLTVINGYSQLMLRRIEPGSPLQEPLQQVRNAGQRAAELSRQLLAFSRKQVASPSPLLLNHVIREAETMLRRLLGADVHLITHLDPAAGTVLADAGQMQQVLMNLLVNARDAMPNGGTVSIATASVDSPPIDPLRDPEAPSGPYVLLAVQDTGVGMDAETQQHAFEPFFTTKDVGQGTGLGLATVYGIVKQNHGWIRVDSEPQKGARFSIYLPRIQASPIEGAHPQAASAGGNETLLLVEDQREVRAFLVESLSSYGYTVLDAASGQEALLLSRQRQGPIDLLVTDMVMPGMSGKELANALEAERPGLRVLMVSGYSAEQITPLGLPPDSFGFLAKPVSPEDLAAAVRNLLESRPPLPSSGPSRG
jgi:two-component system, cell cycle sensor histidine kinase and response regulator CckA